MLLEPHHHAVLLAKRRAFFEIGHHPLQRFVKALPRGRCPAGKDADHRRPQFARHHDPVLHHAHIVFARGFVRHREVIAHAGAADGDAVDEGGPLQVVDVVIGRDFGITGEVVSGWVQRIHTMLRAEEDGIRERHAALAQGPVEGVGVQSQLELDSRFPRDPGWRGNGGRGHQAGGPAQEFTAIDGHGEEMLLQRLEYNAFNPVKGRRW